MQNVDTVNCTSNIIDEDLFWALNMQNEMFNLQFRKMGIGNYYKTFFSYKSSIPYQLQWRYYLGNSYLVVLTLLKTPKDLLFSSKTDPKYIATSLNSIITYIYWLLIKKWFRIRSSPRYDLVREKDAKIN